MPLSMSSTWRTMRPLRRILSSSAADLQTIAILNNAQRLGRNCFHRTFAVDLVQLSLGAVILHDRERLLLVFLQALGYHFLAIVAAGGEQATVNVAQVSDTGRLKVNVVDPPAGGTRTTSG